MIEIYRPECIQRHYCYLAKVTAPHLLMSYAKCMKKTLLQLLPHIRIFNSSSVNLAPFLGAGLAASVRTGLDEECESVSRNAVSGPTFLGFGTGFACCCGFLSCFNSSALHRKCHIINCLPTRTTYIRTSQWLVWLSSQVLFFHHQLILSLSKFTNIYVCIYIKGVV